MNQKFSERKEMLKNYPTEVALACFLNDDDFYIPTPKLVYEFIYFLDDNVDLAINNCKKQYPDLEDLAIKLKSEIKCKYDKYWNLPQLIKKYGFPKELTFRGKTSEKS